MRNGESLKLQDLAERAGVSARTVRYYVQRGLLPAPAFRGKDTSYGEEHLLRLSAIKLLQDRFLPLDAIQAELSSRDVAGLRVLLSHPDGELGVAPVQATSVTAAPSRRAEPPASLAGTSIVRHVLAPGVELLMDAGAPKDSQELCRRILQSLAQPPHRR